MTSSYGLFGPQVEVSFPWRSTWALKAPSKVMFFVWTAIKGGILTLDNFQNRGFSFPNVCSLCLSDAESVGLIFFYIVLTLIRCGLLQSCDQTGTLLRVVSLF